MRRSAVWPSGQHQVHGGWWLTATASVWGMAAWLWLAALVLAPHLMAGIDHPLGNRAVDGVTSASASVAVIYALGWRVCHQRAERSFFVEQRPMPVCARCFGLYSSAAIGLLIGWWRRVTGEARWVRVGLLAALAPSVLTVVVEWAGLAQPGNLLRAISAVPAGLFLGALATSLLLGAPRRTPGGVPVPRTL